MALNIVIKSRGYCADQWERRKSLIHYLYIEKNNDSKTVRQILARDHDFHTSKNKFVNMLKQWGFRKYSTRKIWESIRIELEKEGVDLSHIEAVELDDGRVLTAKKLKKELSRYGALTTSDLSERKSASNKLLIAQRSVETPVPPASVAIVNRQPPEIGPPRLSDSRLLTLPMFDLLRLLSTILPNELECYLLPSDIDYDCSAKLLTLYSYIKIRLSNMVQTAERGNGDWQSFCQDSRDIIDASRCISDGLDIGDRGRKLLGDNIVPGLMEAVLPVVDVAIGPDAVLELHTIEPVLIDEIATVFYVFYLCANDLIDNDALDVFYRWAINVKFAQSAIATVALSTSYVASQLRTMLLHAAIRNRDSAFIEELLDIRSPQLGFMKVMYSPNEYEFRKVSPLQAAIVLQDVKLVETLINAGIMSTVHIVPNTRQGWGGLFLHTGPITLAAQSRQTLPLLSTLRSHVKLGGTAVLAWAIHSGATWDLLHELMRFGADVNECITVNGNSMSVVHIASAKGDEVVLQQLLALGLDADGSVQTQFPKHGVDCRQDCCVYKPSGPTPLMLAIENNALQAAQVLLDYGAEVNEEWDRRTPLSIAVQKKMNSIIEILLGRGAYVGPINRSTLMWYAICNHDVQTLVVLGGQAALSPAEWTILWYEAARVDNIDAISHFAARQVQPGAHLEVSVLNQAIMQAAICDKVRAMRLLFDIGANINTRCNTEGQSLLESAARRRSYKAVVLAMSLGADNLEPSGELWKERGKDILLTLAAAKDEYASVVDLLRHGASSNGDNQFNAWVRCPVTNAIQSQNYSMLQMLIRQGVDLHVHDGESATLRRSDLNPVELAMVYDFPKALSLLAPLEQAPNCREDVFLEFWTAVVEDMLTMSREVVCHLRNLASWKLILTWQSTLAWAFRQGPVSDTLAEILIKDGALIDPAISWNLSPLQSALMNRRFDFARKLVEEEGAEVNSEAGCCLQEDVSDKVTALQAACHQAHVPSVKLLLDYHARAADSSDSTEGRTALQIASAKGLLSIVQLLLNAGAQEDAHFEDAVDAAALYGRLDVLKLLLDSYKGSTPVARFCRSAYDQAEMSHQVAVMQFLEEYQKSFNEAGTSF